MKTVLPQKNTKIAKNSSVHGGFVFVIFAFRSGKISIAIFRFNCGCHYWPDALSKKIGGTAASHLQAALHGCGVEADDAHLFDARSFALVECHGASGKVEPIG